MPKPSFISTLFVLTNGQNVFKRFHLERNREQPETAGQRENRERERERERVNRFQVWVADLCWNVSSPSIAESQNIVFPKQKRF